MCVYRNIEVYITVHGPMNVKLRRVRGTIVAAKEQCVIHNLCLNL